MISSGYARWCMAISLWLATGLGAAVAAPTQDVTVIEINTASPRVYEKYEIRFDIPQTAQHPLFGYDDQPPPGIPVGSGVSVDAIIVTPSGKTLRHPAFYMEDVERSGEGQGVYYQELPTSSWMLRFSPQEIGLHQVSIAVTAAAGVSIAPIGSFTALSPMRPGFIGISPADTRYFTLSDGNLFWPIGPANGYGDYDQYRGTGLNFDRPWLGGVGAYSTNWARWLSSAEDLGNEGAMSHLSFREHAPGSELSYELTYPDAFRYWITNWLNEDMGPRFKPNTTYQIMMRLKTVGLSGPRDSRYDWGLVARTHAWLGLVEPIDVVENALRDVQPLVSHITENRDWFTLESDYTTSDAPQNDISLYLDNVTGGSVYIDEFQIREVLADGSLGGSVIRNPKADLHTYVDPRGAAKIDWIVEQAEKNGVYLKLVVHDKNDWIQNHLKLDGSFADEGDGYYQSEDSKARWLLRQWYRYLAARWGYSTAIHSWELNNEGPPDAPGGGTAPHWETAQAFARYMHQIDAHPHLATTSFWCCWRPEFWGNEKLFPDIDYADLHEYTREDPLGADMAAFHVAWSEPLIHDPIGKPVIRAETGINTSGWYDDLQQPNPGIWYRHLLWSSLDAGALFEPGYWFAEHLAVIPRIEIAQAFARFVNDLDVHQGGYVDLKLLVSNPKMRVVGQKNPTASTAFGWVQNAEFTWRSALDGQSSVQSGTITITLATGGEYAIGWYNTSTGQVERTETITATSEGTVTLTIENLAEDVAFRVAPAG